MKRIFVLLAVLATFSMTGCLGGGSGGGSGPGLTGPISNSPMQLMAGATKQSTVSDDYSEGSIPGQGTAASLDKGIDGGSGTTLITGQSIDLLYNGQTILELPTGPDGAVHLYDNGYLAGEKQFIIDPEDPGYAASQAEAAKLTPVAEWYDPPHPDTGYTSPVTDHTGAHSATFDGRVVYTKFEVALNADKTGGVPLEYSTFGAWSVNVDYNGELTFENGAKTPPDQHINNTFYQPIYGSTATSVEGQPAANSGAFTGNVMAMARQEGIISSSGYTADVFESLQGTASLTIGADPSQANLALALKTAADNANFYDIAYNNISITNTGAMSASGAPVVTGNGGRGITMDTNNIINDDNEETYLRGQFYGNNVSNISEAVGAFRVTDRNETTIQGAFGVKK